MESWTSEANSLALASSLCVAAIRIVVVAPMAVGIAGDRATALLGMMFLVTTGSGPRALQRYPTYEAVKVTRQMQQCQGRGQAASLRASCVAASSSAGP